MGAFNRVSIYRKGGYKEVTRPKADKCLVLFAAEQASARGADIQLLAQTR